MSQVNKNGETQKILKKYHLVPFPKQGSYKDLASQTATELLADNDELRNQISSLAQVIAQQASALAQQQMGFAKEMQTLHKTQDLLNQQFQKLAKKMLDAAPAETAVDEQKGE